MLFFNNKKCQLNKLCFQTLSFFKSVINYIFKDLKEQIKPFKTNSNQVVDWSWNQFCFLPESPILTIYLQIYNFSLFFGDIWMFVTFLENKQQQ